MRKILARVRIFSESSSPFLATSATLTEADVKLVVSDMNISSKPVILRASPIQDHFKFVMVKRPSNASGMEGNIDKNGLIKPGLLDLLKRIYLDEFIKCTLTNEPVKKCIIFFRTENHMLDVHDYVREKLPNLTDPLTKPYVMNHGGVGPLTSKSIIERRNEINLFLTTRFVYIGMVYDYIMFIFKQL